MYRLYEEGKGVEKDHDKAMAYLRLAVDWKDEQAMATLKRIDPTYVPVTMGQDVDDPWLIRDDVIAGFYERRTFRFDAQKQRHLKLRLKNFTREGRFAPSQIICLTALAPSDHVCMRLIGSKAENEFAVRSEIVRTNFESTRNEIAFPVRFMEDEEIDVRIFVLGNKAHFVVNGDDRLALDIDFPVELMSISCSTAACQVEMEKPALASARKTQPATR
jgi:hypothetical protein